MHYGTFFRFEIILVFDEFLTALSRSEAKIDGDARTPPQTFLPALIRRAGAEIQAVT